MRVLAISGYKPHELAIYKEDAKEIYFIQYAIKKRLLSLMDQGLEWVVISGQRGVEQWSAEVVFQLQDEGYPLQLAVLPPFLYQESIWQEEAQTRYIRILERAHFTAPISNRSYESPLQLKVKNEFIIAKTDGILLLYSEDQQGSPDYYLQVAENRHEKDGYPIYLISPDDLQDAVYELSETEEFDEER